jgi:hypothetical protein
VVLDDCAQVDRARQGLPLADVVKDMEFKLMKKFVTRNRNRSGTNFSFFVAMRHNFRDGRCGLYVRSLEFGMYVGLAQKLFTSNSLHDVILSFDDASTLASAKIRGHPRDSIDAKEMWAKFFAQIEQTSTIVHAAFILDGVDAGVSTCNISCEDINSAAKSLSASLQVSQPHFHYLSSFALDEHASESDLNFAWNCLPNVDVQYKIIGRKGKAATAIQATSIRSHATNFICDQSISSEDLIRLCGEFRAVKYPTQVRARTSAAKSTKNKGRSRFSTVAVNVDSCDNDSPEVPWFLPAHPVNTTVADFQSALRHCGLVRVLRNDARCVRLLWNSYNSRTALLNGNSYSTTTCSLRPMLENIYVCENCDSFRHSIELQPALSTSNVGYCIHTTIFKRIIDIIRDPSRCSISRDPFVTWLQLNIQNKASVLLLTKDRGLHKFLVQVSDGIARNESTNEIESCHVWTTSFSNRVSCSGTRCVRVTMKGIKSINEVQQLCCHLRAIFEHPDFNSLWTRGFCLNAGVQDEEHESKSIDEAIGECDLTSQNSKSCIHIVFHSLNPIKFVYSLINVFRYHGLIGHQCKRR